MPNGSSNKVSSDRKLSPLPQFSALGSLRPDTMDRNMIPSEYKWSLSDIYSNWEDWEKDLNTIENLAGDLAALKGRLSEGFDVVEQAFRLSENLGLIIAKAGAFSHLHFDLDQRNNEINARQQRAQLLGSKIATMLSWFTPELLNIPWETMDEWIGKSELLTRHRFPISETYRRKKHILDEAGEKLLSYSRRLTATPASAYEMLSTADIRWPSIQLSTGESKVVSPSNYSEILETSRIQADRRAAFEAHFGVYKATENTYAALYNAVCQRDLYITKARNYRDTLECELEDDAIPTELFDNLIKTTKKGVAPLQRYHRLRKKTLKLEKYDLYDSMFPLMKIDKKYPYDSVKELILTSVAPLGSDYQDKVRRAFQSGWIDVYENDGKRSGAYSAGVYGIHPFILLNYNDTLDYMFTLAHEMGHSLHTLHSQETQPFATAGYTIFVAEVASTLNEALLLEHLLKLTNDPKERIVLIEHSIHNIISTFYTQVRFADFEREAHRLVEEDKPVTSTTLNELMFSQLQEALGDSVDLHELYRVTWARIPHFYRTPYYVYQYATSFAASANLIRNILPDGQGLESPKRLEAVSKYLTLLRSGGNDHPLEQLRKAGVDLLSPEPIQAVIDTLDLRVTQLEQALESL